MAPRKKPIINLDKRKERMFGINNSIQRSKCYPGNKQTQGKRGGSDFRMVTNKTNREKTSQKDNLFVWWLHNWITQSEIIKLPPTYLTLQIKLS